MMCDVREACSVLWFGDRPDRELLVAASPSIMLEQERDVEAMGDVHGRRLARAAALPLPD